MNIDHEVAVPDQHRRPAREFVQLCDYPTNNRNRKWLIRRIAWRLQAYAEGGLPERARARAAGLANEAELRATATHGAPVRRALVELGYLDITRRSIPQPLHIGKCARIM